MSSTIRSIPLLLQAPPEISWDKYSQVRNAPTNYLAAAAFLWVLVFLLASLCPTKQSWVWCSLSPCGTLWDGLATDGMLAMDRIQVFPILQPVCLAPAPATQLPPVQSLQSWQQEEVVNHHLSCRCLGKGKCWTSSPGNTPPFFHTGSALLFLHLVICTATNVSVCPLLTGNTITYAELHVKPQPQGNSREETSAPGTVQFCLVTNYRCSFSYCPTVKPVIKSLYVHSRNEGLIYHFIWCFFPWILRFYTFLLKVISTNAFVPYMENLVKQSKIPCFFITLMEEESQGWLTITSPMWPNILISLPCMQNGCRFLICKMPLHPPDSRLILGRWFLCCFPSVNFKSVRTLSCSSSCLSPGCQHRCSAWFYVALVLAVLLLILLGVVALQAEQCE